MFHAPPASCRAAPAAATVRCVNPDAEGTTYPEVTFEVTPQRVQAFADVFGGGPGVPPTLLATAEFTVMPTIIADPRLAMDFTRVVHGSQEYEYIRAPRVGETLIFRARLDSVKVRGRNGFLTIVMDVVDGSGTLVAKCRSTMIERGDA
jgi:N-terminal half of MaoC dehydratase